MFAILVLLLSCYLVKGNEKKVTKCEDLTSGEIQVPLSCESDEMIHVVREISGPRVSTGVECKINITNTDLKSRDRTNNGLFVNCNGRSACNETHAGLGKLNHSAVRVEYDCVGGSISMCSESSKQFSGNPLYLHSPGFPGNTELRKCKCEMRGDMMTVELLEYNTTGTGWKIVVDNEAMPNTTFWHLFFNKVIFYNVAQIRKLFIDGHATDGKVWLKVTVTSTAGKGGNASIEGTCKNPAGSLSTASTPDSQVTVSSPQARDETEGATTSGTIVGATVGCIILIVVVVAVVVIVKKRRNGNQTQHNTQSNRDLQDVQGNGNVRLDLAEDRGGDASVENGSSQVQNIYNSLSPYENTDADHNYRQIQLNSHIEQVDESRGTSTYSGLSHYRNTADDHDYRQLEK